MNEGLRERARRTMRAELAAVALDMFVRDGFDQTTVDDIARAAGLSKRSFFRYFPTKEDAVLGGVDALSDRVADEIRGRPADEPPWESLRHVLGRWEEEIHASQQELAGARLIETTPSLRAGLLRRREEWRARVGEALLSRREDGLDPFTADLLTGAAAAALDAVSREWVRSGGAADRRGLLDRAFRALRPAAD